MSKIRHIKGYLWQKLGRCYYCGHTKAEHKERTIMECLRKGCDCFGFDFGPEDFSGR